MSATDNLLIISPLLLSVSVVGVGLNLASLYIFTKQKYRKDFHRLLITLAAYDLLVVVFCALLYWLPHVWPEYAEHAYPRMAPLLLPLVHIALMSSVYCTVVLSCERYVRICLAGNPLANSSYFSSGKFKLYLATIIVFPVVFYTPKFFEVETTLRDFEYNSTVDCHNLTALFPERSDEHYKLHTDSQKILQTLSLPSDPASASSMGGDRHHLAEECARAMTSSSYVITVVRREPVLVVVTTWLRRHPLYYRVYCVALNTVFATAAPFALLLFFNVSTVVALAKLGKRSSHFVGGSFGSTVTTALADHNETEDARKRRTTDGRHGNGNGNGTASEEVIYLTSRAEKEHGQVGSDAILAAGPPTDPPTDPATETEAAAALTGSALAGSALAGSALAGSALAGSGQQAVNRRNENRLTRISMAIVWLFLFCHTWKLIPTGYEVFVGEIEKGPEWLRHVQHVSHALIVLNSSVNFLIYVAL